MIRGKRGWELSSLGAAGVRTRNIALSLALSIVAGVAHAGEPVKIHVDARQRAAYTIPATMWGTFLEPIGNSTYNGLWAELLRNPSFEDNLWNAGAIAAMLKEQPELRRASNLALPLPWEPLNEAQGNRYEPRYGHAANSWRSLYLMGLPGVESGVKQRVYLPLERERRYQGSIYVRGSAEIKVALRTRSDAAKASVRTLAEARIEARGDEWRKYAFTLEVPEGSLHALEPADFVIALGDAARVEIDQASLMPADALDGLDPEMVALSKEMHTKVVRFGGNYTSAYHWPDGVGERDKRVSMLNVAWGMPEYNTFGTDEFLHFCRLIGAEPQIALNLGTGTADEAAAWVRYVNEHWNNGRGGLMWELGNELWGNWNTGYPQLSELAGRTRRFSEAVRRVDPNARLIATGQDPDAYEKWNATQLSAAPGTFDFLSTHFVVTIPEAASAGQSAEALTRAAYALPVELGRRLRAMSAQIGSSPHAGRAKLAFTEWLYLAGRQPAGTPQYDTLGGALCAAGMFNMLMRNADIVPVSDMTGGIEFAGLWKKHGRVYATPAYHLFRMYAGAGAHSLVTATAEAGSYEVHGGVRRLPEIQKVPYLDVVAALDETGAKLLLFCINRHLTAAFDGEISIDGLRAVSGTAETLKAASRADRNDEEQPHAVEPVRGPVEVKAGVARYVFPSESVTVIELHAE